MKSESGMWNGFFLDSFVSLKGQFKDETEQRGRPSSPPVAYKIPSSQLLLPSSWTPNLSLLTLYHFHAVSFFSPTLTAIAFQLSVELEASNRSIEQALGFLRKVPMGRLFLVEFDHITRIRSYVCRCCHTHIALTRDCLSRVTSSAFILIWLSTSENESLCICDF